MDATEELRHLVARLEERVAKLENSAHTRPLGAPFPVSPLSAGTAEAPRPLGHSSPSRLLIWLRTDTLMKLGAFLLLLALAWFVNYAFANNWIGSIGRISLGMILGVGLLACGYFVALKRPAVGHVLVALGEISLLVTLFAARSVYDFFTPASALTMMGLVVALTAVIAIVQRSLSLGILALIGGAVAPLLTNAPRPDYTSLLVYVALLDAGAIFVASFRGWRVLTGLALITTGFYNLALYEISQPLAWIFIGLFFALFFGASIGSMLNSKRAGLADLITVAGNALLFIVFVSEHVPEHMQSIAVAAAGGVSVIAAFLLISREFKTLNPVYLYAGTAIALLGAATAFELQGSALTIAASIETFIVIAASVFLLKDRRAVVVASVLHVIPLVLAFEQGHFSVNRWMGSETFFSDHFFVVLTNLLSLGASAGLALRFHERIAAILVTSAWLVGGSLIWLGAHTIFEIPSTARAVALVIFAIIGVSLFFQGVRHSLHRYRIAGGIVLGAIVVRLLFLEVWQMPLAWRVITFLIIGALLVVTAFFQKKLAK